MARHLSDEEIRSTLAVLLQSRNKVSGRALRRALRERYGVVGRTERIFHLWREMTVGAVHGGISAGTTAGAQLLASDLRLQAAEARAALAEERERAHQDRWAHEIHTLRQQLAQHEAALPKGGVSHDTYHRLYAAYVEVRRRLARHEPDSALNDALVAPDSLTPPDK